ncbi:MAG: DUF2493 domain-containing protein [Nocardioidaceae bacterium]|nr:DUF2493 domain-containing protein [Nocardioidaceae bacterium]
MKRILVTGPRWLDDVSVIGPALDAAYAALQAGDDVELVHGNCRGVDRVSAAYWSSKGLPVKPVEVTWQHGRYARFASSELATSTGVDLCVAFVADPVSRGTAYCMARAQDRSIPVTIVPIARSTSWSL